MKYFKLILILIFVLGLDFPKTTRSALSSPLRIAIIDTGYNSRLGSGTLKLCSTGHYDFQTKKNKVGSRRIHGTAVGSIIGDELKDVPYCAIIYQVETDDDDGYFENTIKAMEMVKKEGVVAVNLSIEGYLFSFRDFYQIQKLAKRGVAIFIAAGNKNINLDEVCISYPGCYEIENTYIVGATAFDSRTKSAYSNYGRSVKIWEPGYYDLHGRLFEGTSFAAPRALSDYVRSLYLLQSSK